MPSTKATGDVSKLHAAIDEKNQQLYYDYRAVNGYYIYGGRKKPFGVENYPAEVAGRNWKTGAEPVAVGENAQ